MIGYGLRYEYGIFKQTIGLTAQQVADSRSWYNPNWHYEHEPETRAALDLMLPWPASRPRINQRPFPKPN